VAPRPLRPFPVLPAAERPDLPVVVSTRRGRADPREMGPVLLFRGRQADRWRVSALFVLRGEAEPPDLEVDGVRLAVPPRHVASLEGRTAWRYDFAVPRAEEDRRVAYGFRDEEERWRFCVPGLGVRPRFAYASCNGWEDEAPDAPPGPERNARWSHMLGLHRSRPFHLLLMGGDQIYADRVWRAHPELEAWFGAPARRRPDAPLSDDAVAAADRWYADLYVHHWRQAEVAAVLSSLPAVMMWDDHDVFDGFNSHPDADRGTPAYRRLAEVARRHFALFQQGCAPDDPHDAVWGAAQGTFSQDHLLDGVGLLVPDLRSERTPGRVMSAQTWAALPGRLGRLRAARHLFVMSSVPVAFPDLSWAERLANILPGQGRYEDDLRDQWGSYAHREEHARLIGLLAEHARTAGARVAVLSGEVHLAHAAEIRADGAEMLQLTSSGIAHPPPSPAWPAALERIAGMTRRLPGGAAVAFPPLPGGTERFVPARNWMSLVPRDDGPYEARWHAEGRADAPPMVV